MRIILIFLVPLCALFVAVSTPVCAHPGLDKQIVHLDGLIEQSPEDAALYLRRGEVHRLDRHWDLAKADLLHALKLDGSLWAAEISLAKIDLANRNLKGARKRMTRVLDNRSDIAEAWIVRARALNRLGRHLAAAADYDTAFQLFGERAPRPDHYLERARALQAAGAKHHPRAVEGLDQGRERLGNPITLQLTAVQLLTEIGRIDEALVRLDEITSRSGRKEKWLIQRGELLEAAGRPEEALTAYRRSLDAIETLPAARQNNRAVNDLREQAQEAVRRLTGES
ncbi:MAG: hypothetical protein GY716_12790 [bacterium]|nr:hypothetical protein [bacterium]